MGNLRPMRFPCSSLVAAIVAALLVAPAGAVEIRAITLSAGTEGTRVVMDLSGRTSHHVMTLTNPDRIVIDISHARCARRAWPRARTADPGIGWWCRLRAAAARRRSEAPSLQLRMLSPRR